MANSLDCLVPSVFLAGVAGLGLGPLLLGHPEICIAVLDGPVDRNHPCFDGANLTVLPTLVADGAKADGAMSSHGTHVASIIFGQPGSPVTGVAPQCRGLIVPVFADDRCSATQLDLARGIEQAANAGAQVINLSGGQLTDFGEAEGWLENAVRLCQERNILLVAAAGNDGCACLHVPAALPNVLAVGAMDARGHPLDFSNWGDRYQQQGILAPGENILGAKPGGGTERLNGTSFATPIVAGVAALLLSEQVRRGETPDPQKVRQLLLQSALPCDEAIPAATRRCLAGKLNLSGAFTLLTGVTMAEELTTSNVEPAGGCGCGGGEATADPTPATLSPSSPPLSVSPTHAMTTPTSTPMEPTPMTAQVTPSQAPSELASSQLVYALGTLGYDFGSEARRDTFKQLMPAFDLGGGTMVPANPY
ncbi:MAG: PatA/PatG family cyanobactin maturation protease, partial [Nodosilinea sp.]